MKDLLEFIRPPDAASPRELRRWQWNVALTLLAVGLFASWTLSPWGFATASDVDDRVEDAATPIRKAISAVKEEQKAQRALLEQTREVVISSQAIDFEGKIVEFKTRMCKAQTEEAVGTWRLLVLDYQNRYIALTGRNYPTPSCADL